MHRKQEIKGGKQIFSGPNSKGMLHENNGGKYFIKYVNKEKVNWRDKFKNELLALKFLRSNGVINIPSIVEYDIEQGVMVLTYIEGERVKRLSQSLLSRVVRDMWNIKRVEEDNSNMVEASDSLINPGDFVHDIENRINSSKELKGINKEEEYNLNQLIEMLMRDLNRVVGEYDLVNCGRLPQGLQVFSQSDVGIHNILVSSEKVYFVDFEHAGWDDPAKIICDWVCKCENNMSLEQNIYLSEMLIDMFGDLSLRNRVGKYLDIVNIKWQLIKIKHYKNNRPRTKGMSFYWKKIWNEYEEKKGDLESVKKRIIL